MKLELHYQTLNGVAFDNFCSDAAIGARNLGVPVYTFENVDEIEYSPYKIIVATVEDSLKYLKRNIEAIDDTFAAAYKNKTTVFNSLEETQDYPCFIKPYKQIKAFTGIVVDNLEEARQFTNNFQGQIQRQDIIDIESEYRVYITEERILGVKHYLGCPYKTPEKEITEKIFKLCKENLTNLSYTIDVGIKDNGETFLIEINDGWAIGNYGLSPDKYYQFVKNRWLQLTGVRK